MTRPIHVLHLLVTTSPGGGPKHVYDLVRHLPADDFEVVVAAPRDGIFFDRFREVGVTMVELPLSRLGVRHLPLAMRLIKRHASTSCTRMARGPGCTDAWRRARSGCLPCTPFTASTTAATPGPAGASISASSAGCRG